MNKLSNNVNVSFNVGFTVIELLVAIFIIGILAGLATVSYNSITTKTRTNSTKGVLINAATEVKYTKSRTKYYPETLGSIGFESKDPNVDLEYYSFNDEKDFCVGASHKGGGDAFHVTKNGEIKPGGCPIYIQNVTEAQCPTDSTMVVDKRDYRSYYIKKIGGLCWMATNLAYGGGGDNTFGDVIKIQDGSLDTASVYTEAKYYFHPSNSNPTTYPVSPLIATNGGSSANTRQFGYLYNWCAAMGNQNTAACSNSSTPTPTPSISICPHGWRLPTGEATTGDFTKLNDAINGSSVGSDSGLITQPWLGQRSGLWYNASLDYQGTRGYLWSSTPASATSALNLRFYSSSANPSYSLTKIYALAVRCVAN